MRTTLTTGHRTNPPPGPRSARTVRVRVARSGDAQAEFTVRAPEPATVLDLVREIQRAHDPTLGFRYSCRVAMCGTCAVRVDGRSTLACRAVVAPGVERVEIAPLAGLPVVRDLIVDTRPFWAAWARVLPWFVPGDGAATPVAPGTPEAELVEGALGCISCGACYSACDVARHRSDYLGPAALNRALALVADPRDGARAERLGAVGGAGGLDRCHYVGACTPACPVGLDPASSIAHLRRLRLRARVA